MAALNPLLEVLHKHLRGHDTPLLIPATVVVGKIITYSLILVIEAEHYLMLIESAVGVVLVYHKHPASIPRVYVGRKEHIELVAVLPLRALDLAIAVVHGVVPILARSLIVAAAHTPGRILDSDIETTHLHMPLLIIAALFLRLGRIGIRRSLGGSHSRPKPGLLL